MYPKDAWYVACTPNEIDDKPLGRMVCNERIVFYRGPGGQAAALEDWCPHRGAPLSLGRVVEGRLVCGYHGLEMGSDGKTIAMPGQRVRGFPAIRTYPAVERHGFVWVWPGDPALADPARIHPLPWAEDPEWSFGGGMFHIQCDYRLMIDNLMDLTHEKYVHSTSIGQKELDEVIPTTRTEGDEVITERFMHNIMAPPFWKLALRGAHLPDDEPVDRWQICRFTPPCHVMIAVGVALAGKGGMKLSLRGYAPEVDQFVLTRQALGRRVNLSEPAKSLVLLKPTMAVNHGGGQKLEVGSTDYQVLADWIAGEEGEEAAAP